MQKFAQGKNIFPKIHTRSISHISVLLLHPPISLLCVPVLFFFMGRTSYLSLHLSTELCSSLHKILTGFSGAKDGLDKKDFHAMTNLTFVQNGWYLSWVENRLTSFLDLNLRKYDEWNSHIILTWLRQFVYLPTNKCKYETFFFVLS